MSVHNTAEGRKSKTRVSIYMWGHRVSQVGSDGSFHVGSHS